MIYLDEIWPKYLIGKNISDLKDTECRFINTNNVAFINNPDNYFVSWGENKSKIRHSVIETGFFRSAIHMDTIGLYERSSFNFPLSKKIIEDYNPPLSWKEINSIAPLTSKYPQHKGGLSNWDGIVAICQTPKDRSVWRAGSSGDYYKFLDHIANYYKGKLLLKKHPKALENKEDQKILEEIAIKHGCELHNTDLSVLKTCEAVFVYNSTFVIDAISNNKHVYQYAPGYFWQSGVVQYTGREIPTKEHKLDTNYNSKFLEFLLWKYCFPEVQTTEKLLKIILAFKNSNDLFPLPEDCSYGEFWINTKPKVIPQTHPTPSHLGGHGNITHIDIGALKYLKTTFDIKSVLDIGCGFGEMQRICKEENIGWAGIDGDKNCTNDHIINHDYTKGPLDHGDKIYDLGWSVEFLEHVKEEYIDNFMQSFLKCKIICVTHALPGKKGHHHVNCQLPEHWIQIFEKNGFAYSEKHSIEVRKHSTMHREFMRNTGKVFINTRFSQIN